jgi:YegS/Rv2252/BmrU family lipid kinase
MSATRVIVNPSAGAGRAARRLARAREIIEAAWPDAEWHESRGAGHVSDLCADAAARGFERVLVAGGDGTVHHAVRGLAGSATALGVLPAGTGNDFAAAAGIPADVRAAATMLANGHVREADLGYASDIPFCCTAGFGMDTPALRVINASRMRRGRLLYQYAALRTLFTYAPPRMTLRLGDQVLNGPVFFAGICNTATYAGGNRLAPGASIFDGELDCVVFGDRSRLSRLATFALMKAGRHMNRPGTTARRAAKLHVESDAPCPVTLDGELTPLETPIDVHVRPRALRLMVGSAS